jgi:hypothetical protein
VVVDFFVGNGSCEHPRLPCIHVWKGKSCMTGKQAPSSKHHQASTIKQAPSSKHHQASTIKQALIQFSTTSHSLLFRLNGKM